MNEIVINNRKIGEKHPTYFIADIGANHDGDLDRAIELIGLAGEAGADAAKFQHFKAETIVSDFGFRDLGPQGSHQANWDKSVFEVYKDASIDLGWTPALKKACDECGIAFFTSPYDMDLVDTIDDYVPAHKIGSGDITWLEVIRHIASKSKPVILATGASSMDEVHTAVEAVLGINTELALLQCNTNYTGDKSNLDYVQLNVLRAYRIMYPDLVLGLSDHTAGHTTVLGAVALGGRVIEKHFTDDQKRTGPDHGFSLNPVSWREMVDRTRELESALGTGVKKVEENEVETVIYQRRCIRTKNRLPVGHVLTAEDVDYLRPCPADALPPFRIREILGKRVVLAKEAGEHIRRIDVD